MNLAVVSPGELFGGVERQILDLCRYLQRNDLGSPLVILFHDRELARQLRELGVQPVVLSARNRYDWGLTRQLEALFRERGIDVVHAHGYKAGITCGLVKRKVGFRLVKTEHGKPELTRKRFAARVKGKLNFFLEQMLTRRAVDQVCYVTRDIADFFAAEQGGLKTSVVHNGIDPFGGDGYTRPEDLPSGGFNFGIIGRVSGVKGIPFAIQALARPEVPVSARLVIIGTGDILESLRAEAAESGVADRVLFLGFRKNIYDYIASVDCVLMPSLHEGLPYTILEAMALSRPIIASNVGGLPEVLTDGETGRLVPVGDVAGLAAAMRDMVLDPESARTLGENARQEQARNFTLDAMAGRYREIWSGHPE